MAKKVSDLNISVNLDTDKAQKEARDFQKDIKSLEKQLKNTDRTTDRLENQTQELERRYKAGQVSTKQFEQMQTKLDYRLVKSAKSMKRMREETEKYRKEQSKLGKVKNFLGGGLGRGAAAGLAGGAALGFAAERMVSSFQEQYSEALRDAGTAEMLGVLPKELASMKLALSQLTGFDGDMIADQLLDIRERLGEVVDDATGALGKAGKAINLQADKLIGKGMAQQLAGITDALSRITDEETRLFRAREIFGDEAARMLTTAVKDQEKLNSLISEANKMNLTMTEAQLAASKKANAEFTKLGVDLKSAFRDITVMLAPYLAQAAGQVSSAANYFSNKTGTQSADFPSRLMKLFFEGFDPTGKGNYPDRVKKDLDRQLYGLTDNHAANEIKDFGRELEKLSGAGLDDFNKRLGLLGKYMEQFSGASESDRRAILGNFGSVTSSGTYNIARDLMDRGVDPSKWGSVSGRNAGLNAGDAEKAFSEEMKQYWVNMVQRFGLEGKETGPMMRKFAEKEYFKTFDSMKGAMDGISKRAEQDRNFRGMMGLAGGFGKMGKGLLDKAISAASSIDTVGLTKTAFSLRKADKQKEAQAFKDFADSIDKAKKNARLDAITGGQAEMDRFRTFQDEAKANAGIGAASSFSAGSMGEYEFRRDRQLQAEKIAEEKRLAKEEREFQAALNQRIIEKLDEIGGGDPIMGDDFGGVN